tara:strand:- start:577 stop:972 length:396 start_codon:yes stop_codon:yes gene_type:complete
MKTQKSRNRKLNFLLEIGGIMSKEKAIGVIKITKTMLDKSIIDANKSVVDFALRELGIDYNAMGCGEKHTIDAVFKYNKTMLDETEIRFYRVNNPRGDKRVSIKDLKVYFDVGDTITLLSKDGKVFIEECL